jgi:hypothetical protein
MAVLGKQYTVSDFNKLLFLEQPYVLPQSILDIFKTIESNIEIPTFTTPSATNSSADRRPKDKDVSNYYKKDTNHSEDRHEKTYISSGKHSIKDGKNRKKKDSETHTGAEDWGIMRSFKATKIESKTGIDKINNELRNHLNKMSATNYGKQRDTILEEIRQYLSSDIASIENTQKIADAIFQIISSNKVLSELYTNLYFDIANTYPVFKLLLCDYVANFSKTAHCIEYVDPQENYDEFCRITKLNDKRKTTVLFIVNIMKKGVLEKTPVIDLLSSFMGYVQQNVQEPNQKPNIEEIVENIFTIMTVGFAELRVLPEWASIYETVRNLSNKEYSGSFVSMSNRVLFKLMDILDMIK